MALKQLTPEQIQTMSLEEKDAWWLKNVYRGDMPQLTWRSAITGMVLGSFLSLTNLYLGMRTGWSLGVGITSVILAFALFRVLSRLGLGRDMTILENNAMQSIATAAGYVNAPLFSSFAAYSMVTMTVVPMYQAVVWLLCLGLLGILFAFPLKKRFINDEQLPFPEGMAAGVVMDALHESDEKEGLFKAKLLVGGALLSAFIELLRDGKVMRYFFGAEGIPAGYDDVLRKWGIAPTLRGVPLNELTIRWDTSIIFIATGGLMGIGVGVSLLLGGILNYFILAPLLIANGIIVPYEGGGYGLRQISLWALWGGVACMTTSSLYSFFSRPKIIVDAFRGFFGKGVVKRDVLEHIELPIKVSVIGVPIVSLVLVVIGHAWFGISYWLGAIAVPMVFIFALIAVNSTGLTAITPTGALGKLTQLTYGLLAPGNITTNVMSASITAEVANNASNLLMDIKPGYMLGAKPRHQAVGHVLGGVAGLTLSLPVWYFVLIRGDISLYGTEAMPVPGAVTWRAAAEILMKGLSFLHPTAKIAVVVGAVLGIVIEAVKHATKGRFSLSAAAMGLAFLLNFSDIWAMFLGSLGFWLLQNRAVKWHKGNEEPPTVPGEPALPLLPGPKPWYVLGAENTETICAGVIAGGALMGISLAVLGVLVLPDVAQLQSVGEAFRKVLGGGP
ncbi:OPT family oligopeptide transporter [Chondromyces apiculatus]|uniref:Oligopeptide transporter, OPT family n=1 Tax=Chondromyces apiculatus DSM 436 TaxID=1192034 RepID=A0A017SXD2_9BACT|nr:OPT family oligopeptide transporter [Chondromyces apiculatus]EYF01593.1 oligopeptide transporter, OPT family [Chondromyces apiculatus DSM 436]